MLFLFYVPYLLVFYPASCNWDTVNQLLDLRTGMEALPFSWIRGQAEISCFLNDHHPVFTTLIFAGFFRLGELAGKVNLGIFAYSVLQCAAGAGVFSAMLCGMERLGVRRGWRLAGFCFLAFAPFVPMYLVTMVKDSLYSVCFVAYLLVYAVIALRRPTVRRMIMLLVLSVLLALTKKTGIYLVVIADAGLILLPQIRRMWKSWLACIAVPAALLFLVLPRIIFPAAHIWPGGPQEALSLPIQQVARVVRDRPEAVTEAERDVIDAIVDFEKIPEIYEADSTDPVKDTYRLGATRQERRDFVALWLRYGRKHPATTLAAWWDLCGGYFVPTETISVYTKMPEQYYPALLGMHQPDRLAGPREAVARAYKRISEAKVVTIFFRDALYASWLPVLAIVYCIIRKNRRGLLALLPVTLSVLVLLISPIVSARYMLPLIFVTPFLAALVGGGDVPASGKEEPT